MVTLENALKKRYLDNGDEELVSDDHACVIFAPPRPARLPSVIAINECEIEGVGDLQKVQQLCAGVHELDLAKNRFKDITETLQILDATSRLTALNLSSNDLHSLEKEQLQIPYLPSMKELILNSTDISWNVANQFLHQMPSVEELYLCSNGLPSVELEDEQYPSLKLLHLSGNPISDWDEVNKLGNTFPNLETLVMVDCLLTGLGYPDIIDEAFPNLNMLNISNNKVADWEEIDKLRSFPSLKDARLLGLPLLEGYSQFERRQLLIGRLPNLCRLNGSQIIDAEREDADRAFIRYYMGRDDKPDRYYELEAKYGKLDPLVEVSLKPQMVVNAVLRFGDRRIQRNVYLKQTVTEFKLGLQEFTGLPASRMRVFHFVPELADACGIEELRFASKFLYSYFVHDGDEFIIDEKP